jgi:hypothetical protein
MQRRALVLALPALAATACTSVPLSTMWRLRSFSADDFFALNPNDLRAAVRTDARASFSAVDIEITAKPKDAEPNSHRIRLQQAVATDTRLEPAPPNRRWFVFALGAEGVKVFESVRRDVAALRKVPGSSLTLGIGARESVVPPDIAKALPMRLDLLLDPAQGWFTMVSETRLDTTRATKA